jgi:hypothetical protein
MNAQIPLRGDQSVTRLLARKTARCKKSATGKIETGPAPGLPLIVSVGETFTNRVTWNCEQAEKFCQLGVPAGVNRSGSRPESRKAAAHSPQSGPRAVAVGGTKLAGPRYRRARTKGAPAPDRDLATSKHRRMEAGRKGPPILNSIPPVAAGGKRLLVGTVLQADGAAVKQEFGLTRAVAAGQEAQAICRAHHGQKRAPPNVGMETEEHHAHDRRMRDFVDAGAQDQQAINQQRDADEEPDGDGNRMVRVHEPHQSNMLIPTNTTATTTAQKAGR